MNLIQKKSKKPSKYKFILKPFEMDFFQMPFLATIKDTQISLMEMNLSQIQELQIVWYSNHVFWQGKDGQKSEQIVENKIIALQTNLKAKYIFRTNGLILQKQQKSRRMSEKKVVKKVLEKPKEVKRLPTSSYSTRPKISRTYQTSTISFGSDAPQKNFLKTNSSFMKYHNESCFHFDSPNAQEPVSRKEIQRRLKTEQFNSKLPTYNPKMANRSQIVFGDEKPNFAKKPASEFTSPSRIPPGGRSQIVFG